MKDNTALLEALDSIDPSGLNYQDWLYVGMALKYEGLPCAVWNQWSRKDPSRWKAEECEVKWKSFSAAGGGGRTGATIFFLAKQRGWNSPLKNDRRPSTLPASGVPDLTIECASDFQIYCLMDEVQYTSKPPAWEIRKREIVPTPPPQPFTLKEFEKAVTSGRTFYPTVFSKERSSVTEDGKQTYTYRAISQQIFVVDIDNEKGKAPIKTPLAKDEALLICQNHGIMPFLVYETFSSKDHREDPEAPYTKFRICFALDEPMTVQEYGEQGLLTAREHFTALFGEAADSSITDTSRMIFGTDEKEDEKEQEDAVWFFPHLINKKRFAERLLTKSPVEQQDQAASQGNLTIKEPPPFVFFKENTNKPYVYIPKFVEYIREHLDYRLVRDNAKHGLLIYVYENGCYRLYSDDMLQGKVKQYIETYDPTLVKPGIIREALWNIRTDLNYIRQDELNADESLINFQNGLLQVTENAISLLPHSPDVYSTIQIPCDWTDTPGPTPVFDAYIKRLTNGDQAVEQLLLEFIGACISNVKGWRMKKALFLVGEGDTGKSQLKSLVEMLLGKDNYVGIDLAEIEARFGTGMIYGTRLAGSSDMSFLSVDELKTFKKITGGDSLFSEFKGQQGFSYTYSGLLWFCMNRLPKFGGDDGPWVYDRIMVVQCPNVIPKNQQDKRLLEKMYAERDGIIHKAINALQNVIGNGYCFSEPESVLKTRQKYQSENNTVLTFLDECMCPWPDNRIPTSSRCTTGMIYKVYRAWCQENNNGYAKTAKEFRETLARNSNSTSENIITRQRGNSFYKDYCLTKEAKQQFPQVYGYDDVQA